MTIDDGTIREQARRIILDHAKDIEYLSIGEMIADFDEFSSLPEDEFDRVQGRIDKQIRNAVVTVSWPDEQQPADAVSGEQQDGAVGRGTTPRDWWRTRGACRYCGCDVHQDDPAEPVGDGVAHPTCHQRAQERIAECAAPRDAAASKEA